MAKALVYVSISLAVLMTGYDVNAKRQRLLLVSFDGFRWDFDQDVDTPNLDMFTQEGTSAPYVTPAYPTLTGPDHITIATGLYPESHGVVHNKYFDKETGVTFSAQETEHMREWYDNGAEPIWNTVKKQGKRAGVYMFYGGFLPMQGMLPDRYVTSNSSAPYDEAEWQKRINTIMDWFLVDGLDFVALHWNQPDKICHAEGPESEARREEIRKADRFIGYLVDQVKGREQLSDLNVILTADHGMITADPVPNPIEIYRYVPRSDLRLLLADYGPLALIQPEDGKLQDVYNVLRSSHPNMTVYLKEDFPERFHFANNPRIPDIIALADSSFIIHSIYPGQIDVPGQHGYDNALLKMKAIFRAQGPAFRRGYTHPRPFDSVHMYPLMCEILGVSPAPNNGTIQEVRELLDPGFTNRATSILSSGLFAIVSVVLVLLFGGDN
ncbi:ENPP7 [Branchiostoma lanceolatum]|uniref:ENPP7 protein n=1 Tax=Branchiostoma lanceolatum TaxID=7740 RepID=A0A8J9W721_BRALA|nr:ENPP7 [Branchiostoma lanceolatum]